MFDLMDADLFNSENLKNGKITTILSEFNSLKKLKENDALYFTGKISIFDSLVESLELLEKLILNDPCFDNIEEKYTKRLILVIACIFQFIGKPDALQFGNHGISSSKNYEIFSSELSASLLKRTTLSDREIQLVVNIIKNSTVFEKIIKSDNEKIDQDIINYKTFLGEIFRDLLYLFWANIEASELKNTDKVEYKFIKNCINKLLI